MKKVKTTLKFLVPVVIVPGCFGCDLVLHGAGK